MRYPVLFICLGVAACGGEDGATVEGTFAPGSGPAPTGVWVAEAERNEPADSSGFAVGDLTPGPVSLRLMQGRDTAAILNVENLPPGATLRLLGLRVDPGTRLAFPRSVELGGVDIVRVNGMRLAPEGRVPREVDVTAAVLGYAPDAGALLVRPGDTELPDLRVVIGMGTEMVGEAASLQPGDSVRVEGRSERGYVVATRISLPASTALLETPLQDEPAGPRVAGDGDAGARESAGGGGGGDGGDAGGDDGAAAAAPVRVPPAASTPVVRRADPPGRGRGNGNARGEEKGGGRGKKPKN